MTTTVQQIDRWLAVPSEHQRLEFKEAKRQFDFRKLCRYCVALANEGGGHLLMGVTDKRPRAIVGTSVAKDSIRYAEKLFEALKFRVDIEVVDHPDGRVVMCHIPGRPTGTAYAHQGAYLMRAGAQLVPMSEDRLRQIFSEGADGFLEQPVRSGLNADEVLNCLERSINRGLAVGFEELIAFVLSYLPQREVIGSALRETARMLPEIVVRELIANAIVHQDFNMRGASPMVEIFAHRVEISNPGEPIVPVARFLDAYQSRNERFAGLMRRMRICEEKGSGIDKVVAAVEDHQLPAPDFRVGVGRTSVVAYGPKTFAELDQATRIRACYQHCCLRWAADERLTNTSLRNRFTLERSKSALVSQLIAATVAADLIRPDPAVGNSKRHARYLPAWA